MKILVTGGSGFIGTHVTKRLMDDDHQVRVFDISPPRNRCVEFAKGNINVLKHVKNAVKNIDVVVHLAGIVGVGKTEKYPLKTLITNVQGTLNVLKSCINQNVEKIIFSSSSEVYGEPQVTPIPETHPLAPQSPYAVSKVACEEFIKAYGKEHGLKFLILRFFNVYGPGQSTDFVVSRFVFSALKNQTLFIHGDGKQTRAFCHVEDVAKAVSLAVGYEKSDTFNIGNNTEPITIEELAKKIISLLRSKSDIQYLPFEATDRGREKEILTRIPDISKAKKLLGYSPTISLEKGIKSVAEYFSSC
jgi:UDP-glucose 4-epimerase|uniref:NAD-dependent epimerase/dehydratase family protein n=1 Tax=candidate division WOR-3 bacterium TaxID=2052148 RepID=A0A7V3NUM6_UNCW3